jgi:hypothetical protein
MLLGELLKRALRILDLLLGGQEAATNAAFTMSDSSEPVNQFFQSVRKGAAISPATSADAGKEEDLRSMFTVFP